MELTKLFFLFLFIVFLMAGQGLGGRYSLSQNFKTISKLFVFGDSYVDTGNMISKYDIFNFPYGITFPGKPDGRGSDGYVLTDWYATFLGLEFPIPYLQLYNVENPALLDGVNFAFGGTGVLDTIMDGPNLTKQIDLLHELIDNSTFTPQYINYSSSLISVSGNDYLNNLILNYRNITKFVEGLKSNISLVVDKITDDLKRIHSLGVKKVVVTSAEPMECKPIYTLGLSYKHCHPILSFVPDYHNFLLQEAVTKLNNEATTNDAPFSILDVHAAFSSIIQNKGYPEGNITFPTPLEPCCKGECGKIDARGNKMYELCEDPSSAFYWDGAHPTHKGWFAALSYLTNTNQAFLLNQLF